MVEEEEKKEEENGKGEEVCTTFSLACQGPVDGCVAAVDAAGALLSPRTKTRPPSPPAVR